MDDLQRKVNLIAGIVIAQFGLLATVTLTLPICEDMPIWLSRGLLVLIGLLVLLSIPMLWFARPCSGRDGGE